jgi:hypothetical protein
VTPSNIKDGNEISGEIGLTKRGVVLRKYIDTLIDLEQFTLISNFEASSAMTLRMLRWLLMKFL